MAMSLLRVLKEWLKSKQWKRDAIQGWDLIESAGSSVADRSFKEVESLRLRYRLEKVNQKLFQVYQSFGKKVVDHWASVYLLTEEERKREVRRIHLLLEEQKKITDQIHELKEPTLSLREVLSKEEKQP
jgi:hypothetical protein